MAERRADVAPTLYLIDGYAQFFRAYHAIRTPMSSPVTKEPTNLTFGFVGMLLKLLKGAGSMGGPAGHVAVALDVSGDTGTFRSKIDPAYKATRPPPPEDLPRQVERCLALLRAIGVPLIGSEGFEADDCIATIVEQLGRERPEASVRIVSKDKDLKQLLTDTDGGARGRGSVALYDIHSDELIDAAKLKEETGLRPAQVADMLALMGDTVDNVKGVDGVGPKTSAELIGQYGTLANLIEHAAEIKGKRGENLRTAVAEGRLKKSLELVRLRHDVPITFDLDAAATTRIKLEALLPILKELGFNRYQDEVRALLGQPAAAAPAESAHAGPRAGPGTPAGTHAAAEPDGAGLFSGTPGLFDAEPGTPSAARAANPHYRCVRTRKDLDTLLKELKGAACFALDTETTGLSFNDAKLCGLSFSTKGGTGWYVPVRSPTPGEHLDEATVLGALRPLLEDPGRCICGHNLKFDLLILRAAGVDFRVAPRGDGGVHAVEPYAQSNAAPMAACFDSMVASFLIDSGRSSHGLDSLALALLGHTNISISELIGSGPQQRTFDTVPLDLATQYAAEDADMALRLRETMLPQLRAMGLHDLFARVEMPLVQVLAELEFNGIHVDPAELDRQRERLAGQIKAIRSKIDDAAHEALGRTFNPESPKQLAAALFNKKTDAEPGLGIASVKRTKTGHSTDVEVLEKLAADPAITTPIPALIVEHRQLTKLVGTYLVALKAAIHPRTRRIHCSFHQTVAATGRLASSDPNLQNIPIRTDVGREIRRAFVAPPGRTLVSADYSQIELRILAHLSKDPGLMQAFAEDQDIHTAVAAQINGVPLDKVSKDQRAGAKMVNFGIVYGITAFGLARRLGCPNEQAAEIINAYKKRFSGITTFLQECIDQAQRHGHVRTMLGRRRPITDIDSTNPSKRAFAERIAINSVVQGSAADLIKLAMIDLQARIDQANPAKGASPLSLGGAGGGSSLPLADVRMLLQIHDELVFEAPVEGAKAAQALIVERMENAMALSVPLKADSSVAGNWFEGK